MYDNDREKGKALLKVNEKVFFLNIQEAELKQDKRTIFKIGIKNKRINPNS